METVANGSEGAVVVALEPQSAQQNTETKPTRFFLMKSLNFRNVAECIETGTWATQATNERKLNDAFRNSEVLLIFSINGSRAFQGYAVMTSEIPPKKEESSQDRNQLGAKFQLQWRKVCDLQFFRTNDLRNDMNENKPVKVGRDGQEINPEIGRAVVDLLESCPDSTLAELETIVERAVSERPQRPAGGMPQHGMMMPMMDGSAMMGYYGMGMPPMYGGMWGMPPPMMMEGYGYGGGYNYGYDYGYGEPDRSGTPPASPRAHVAPSGPETIEEGEQDHGNDQSPERNDRAQEEDNSDRNHTRSRSAKHSRSPSRENRRRYRRSRSRGSRDRGSRRRRDSRSRDRDRDRTRHRSRERRTRDSRDRDADSRSRRRR